ncbi:LuxE/PaaK family acyltransferase [Urechidicola croceus]|uniref:Acyl transferase n=1 Tax=Urechidicola croceus TaxID=1850246 RepID=A0A1D8P8Z4_9FLAO|nr:acyl transferase [Urechidicola croceus]AOW21034.1 acyl transferase [Urechidicola croceus]
MITETIFSIKSEEEFTQKALEVFRFQAENCLVYKEFIKHLNINVNLVNTVLEIPFLPIQFFKSHKIVSNKNTVNQIFLSSGTGGTQSQHFVTDLSIYEESYRRGFEYFYGDIKDYVVLALLPSYLERDGSSLIYMVDDLIKKSRNSESGFFLENTQEMTKIIENSSKNDEKLLILGVSYALLDLVERQKFDLKNAIIMETGGMKGRRKEMIREELHEILCDGFGVDMIHSEYGMTELLSQGYSKGNGVFETPPWMKILIRDTEDALTLLPQGKVGGVNVIDLANINSCSFIATQDLGKKTSENSFEVLGRFDNSDIRGCNLLIQ